MSLAIYLFLPFAAGVSFKKSESREFNIPFVSQSLMKSDSTKVCNLFFDYEVIEHYYNPMPDDVMSQGRYVKAEYEKKYAIARYNIPKDISDTAFIDDLTYFGYRKRYMKPTKFRELNKIICNNESDPNPRHRSRCDYCCGNYTDIFVFKKDDSITGIAKISFDGRRAYFVGAQVNTEHFGCNREFEKLKSILGRK